MGLLSSEEEEAIQITWGLVRADMKGVGVKFFLHLFTMFPELQSKFRAFANVPFEQLAEHKKFQAHAFTVMSSINSLIESIDDVEMLTEMLLKIGENHGRRKLQPGDFQLVEDSLLDFFPKAMGELYTPLAKEAWTKTLQVMVKLLREGIESYYAEHPLKP